MERRLYQVHNADKLFYYLFSENETCNLVLRLTLRCRVRRDVLKKALNKTLERFPNFRRQPVLDEQGFLHMMETGREAGRPPHPFSGNSAGVMSAVGEKQIF